MNKKIYFLLFFSVLIQTKVALADACSPSDGDPAIISENCNGYEWSSGNLVNLATIEGASSGPSLAVFSGNVGSFQNSGNLIGKNGNAFQSNNSRIQGIINDGIIDIASGASTTIALYRVSLESLLNNDDGAIKNSEFSSTSIILEASRISDLVNRGTIQSTGSDGTGIALVAEGGMLQDPSIISNLKNHGSIFGARNGINVLYTTFGDQSKIENLENYGDISSLGEGGGITNAGNIVSLKNFGNIGTIDAINPRSKYGIDNQRTISELSNESSGFIMGRIQSRSATRFRDS